MTTLLDIFSQYQRTFLSAYHANVEGLQTLKKGEVISVTATIYRANGQMEEAFLDKRRVPAMATRCCKLDSALTLKTPLIHVEHDILPIAKSIKEATGHYLNIAHHFGDTATIDTLICSRDIRFTDAVNVNGIEDAAKVLMAIHNR